MFRFLKSRKAFSLMEMSVVLASVAAIVVVTVGGVSMINKASLGDVVSDVNKFSKAVVQFDEKYGGIPGDLADVSAISGATAANASNAGNGAIDTAQESLYFWQQLALSGLIQGKYDGSSTNIPGVGVPTGKIKTSGYKAIQASAVNGGAVAQAVTIEFSGFSSSASDLAILKPEDAKSIDEKADDGKPGTGSIRALGSGSGGNCVTGSTYNLSNDSVSCRLQFIIYEGKAQDDADAVTGACAELGSTRESDSTANVCPTGFTGKVMETCRISTGNVGTWQVTATNCVPVTCSGGAKYNETRTLACINDMVGTGIRQTCTAYGVWTTTSSDCASPTGASCSPDGGYILACDYGQTGKILQTCSGTWQAPTNNCSSITCGGSTVGSDRNYAAGCGANYAGTAREVCAMDGTWKVSGINKCVPQYTGACTAGVTADRNIGCPSGETGSHIQTCIDAATDYWVTKTDTCKPITCDGQYVGTTRTVEGQTCPNGKDGIIMQVCSSAGTWTEVSSNCTTAACAGGMDNVGNAQWPNTNASATASVTSASCLSGYTVTGNATRTCDASGVWSGSVTNPCTRIKCGTSYNNATYPTTDSLTNDVAGTCNRPGYQGMPIADCNASGSWTNERGSCAPVSLSYTSNMLVWLDADDFSTIRSDSGCSNVTTTDGATVGCWMDKSGNNFHYKQVSGNDATTLPLLKTSVVNSKAAVRFDGTNDIISGAVTNAASNYTIFLVTDPTAIDDWRYLTGGPVVTGTAASIYLGYYNGAWQTSTRVATANPQILTYNLSTTNGGKIYVDNELVFTGTYSAASVATGYLGNKDNASSGTFWNGDVAEVIIYKSSLSDVDQDIVMDYLGDKWGITLYEAPVGDVTYGWGGGQLSPALLPITNVDHASAGGGFTLAVKTNGTLWAWGNNDYGQLGDGTTTSNSTPTQIGTATNWSQVSAGKEFGLGLKTNGTLWAWGYNQYGQLGDGTTTTRTSPVQIGSATDWSTVVAGLHHSMAIKTDGTLWIWGWNNYGQIGDGTTTNRSTPKQVGTATDWFQVSGGFGHTMAIKNSGQLWMWGYNGYGQLCDGTTTDRTSPIQIGSATNWGHVKSKFRWSLMLKTNGTLWACGQNTDGQLGDGTTTDRSSPTQIGSATNWAQLGQGYHHSVGIRTNGTIWGWGLNDGGQIGDGTTTQRNSPVQIGTDTDWGFIAAGSGHNIAIKGTAPSLPSLPVIPQYGWGRNNYGQVGDGTTTDRSSPVSIGDLTFSTKVAAGTSNLRIKTDGTLWGWGRNANGQLGDGTTTDKSSQVQIGTATNWADIAAGGQHSLAVKTNGTLWGWGYNVSGQVGDGTTTQRTSPVQIGSATNWSKVATGTSHSLAIKTNGTLWAWGYNNNGQLGNGTTTSSSSPVQIGTDTNWAQVVAGANHSIALKTTGTLWGWGYNGYGAVGDGTNTNRSSPVQIGSNTTWSKIAAGSSSNHTVALRTDGTLWAWGYGTYGQIGDGGTGDRTSPTQIGTATDWASIGAGGNHSAAIKTSGTLWGWGQNNYGQVGDGTITGAKLSPVQIGTDTNWAQISVGYDNSIGIK